VTIENDAQLWDHLQRLFGVGTWDDGHEPFWRYRTREAAKIKARRARLHVTVAELVIAADYCKAHRIDIRNAAWLYRHLADAKTWHNQQQRALTAASLDELIADAVAAETTADPDSPWIDRLIRAHGPHRQEVYDAWTATSPHAARPASSA
jgi:hypothetical protein